MTPFQAAPRVTLQVSGPARLQIEGAWDEPTRRWTFLDSYAGVNNLSERVANLELRDESGASIEVRRVAAAEYESARAATNFKYEIDLAVPARDNDLTHVSWIGESFGLLALGDLLPLPPATPIRTLQLDLALPDGWGAATLENEVAPGRFAIPAADDALIFIGRQVQKVTQHVEGLELTLALTPDPVLPPREIAANAARIIREQKSLTGAMPPRRRAAMVMLIPFPRSVPANQWSAETRGGTVVYVTGRHSAKITALAAINVTLAHELFHLWVPHGLRLRGQYEWFYEGFTLYQAMRVAMRTGDLTFPDYLAALGRAYDKYRVGARELPAEPSLLEASRRRWAGQALYVYNKGMVVAFLYDLTLRSRSDGKLTIDDAYRELIRRYRDREADGNAAALEILNRFGAMDDFTRAYVENGGAIDLASAVAASGLVVIPRGARTEVRVSDNLTRAQKKILGQLGYSAKDSIRRR